MFIVEIWGIYQKLRFEDEQTNTIAGKKEKNKNKMTNNGPHDTTHKSSKWNPAKKKLG